MFGDEGNDWMVGGTGQDTMYGGWGNDLLNADDVMTIAGTGTFGDQKGRKIQPSPNDTPDTHPLYQDRAFGGAGLDILIGNTGGDRLIDWVGEFNSYIVPFAPFGIATVSRQVPPWLFEFLYALSASQGADPTRDEDQNATDPDLEARNGEPYGELGLVTQKDHGLWQDQTGGPSDPQPGNIPGGSRDVLRSADFSDGTMMTFAVDTGAWSVSSGVLTVAAASQGQDAAAVWYHDQYLPDVLRDRRPHQPDQAHRRLEGQRLRHLRLLRPDRLQVRRPRRCLEQARDGLPRRHRLAHRRAGGDPRRRQVQHLVRHARCRQRHHVTMVTLNGANYFSYSFAPRVIDGESFGLNKGLLGFGSDNSRGQFDNIQLRVLPPGLTLDRREDFADTAGMWLEPTVGTWAVTGGVYNGTAASGLGLSLADLGAPVSYDAYLELDTVVKAGTPRAGIVFDYYSDTDFKYLMIDVAAGLVVLGHRTPAGWVVDYSMSRTMAVGSHSIKLTMKGASVNVVVDGSTLFGYGYNSALVDGRFGVLTNGTGHVRRRPGTHERLELQRVQPDRSAGVDQRRHRSPRATRGTALVTAVDHARQRGNRGDDRAMGHRTGFGAEPRRLRGGVRHGDLRRRREQQVGHGRRSSVTRSSRATRRSR